MPIILVVDDEVTIRAYLCAYLRECGFLAWGVESADNAIRLLDLGVAADLVFSDMHMPGRHDGYGLARWIAEHRPELPRHPDHRKHDQGKRPALSHRDAAQAL